MNEKLGEQLSAYVDGELPDNEQAMLIRRLAGDHDLQQTWERYHLISDALRNNLPEQFDLGLADRVKSAIDKEPQLHGQSLPARLLRPLAGAAVAASVAAMAIVGLQNSNESSVTGDNGIPQIASAQQVSPYTQVSAGTRWSVNQPGVESRLNGYLVNHHEYSASTELQGMLHYARIAAYDTER
jgi:sigma-E factor negative regulatory protein RseA